MTRASKKGDVLPPLGEGDSDNSLSPKAGLIEIPHTLSVRQLADLLQVSAIDVIKQLMRNGIMANINQAIGYEAAVAVAAGFGYEARSKPQASMRSATHTLMMDCRGTPRRFASLSKK